MSKPSNLASARPDSHPSESHRLVRKLESIAVLSGEERQALLHLPMRVKAFEADQTIVREGDRPFECGLVLTGFVCRHRVVADGRRQIMSFHTPGDIPDLQSLHLKVMDHSLGALVPTTMAFIAHPAMADLIRSHPGIAAALWRDTLIDAAIFREWMVGLGRRSAHQRIAHLLCEMALRFKAVGLGSEHAYELPATQAELADALGLSAVHANRVLQDLRRSELIVLRGHAVTILDWDGLQQAGEFDPGYLHQDHGRPA